MFFRKIFETWMLCNAIWCIFGIYLGSKQAQKFALNPQNSAIFLGQHLLKNIFFKNNVQHTIGVFFIRVRFKFKVKESRMAKWKFLVITA